MSRVVAAGGSIPYAYGGLGQEVTPLPASAPWWGQLIQSVGVPLAQGTASRIAYGRQPSGIYPSGFQFTSPYGTYGGGAFGSFQPSTLLLLGGAALLVLMMAKK
ncbi:MAG: hypothetical protein ACREI9_04620 [Nitrospiraceae bacterium]